MALAEYRRKRHFGKTPEPSGKATKRRSRRQLQFVIQKHAARRLHYDLRLELDGVLVSWAVPKGPSLDPHDKRLAVHVEDHPLDYAGFEGRIPEGEYGAGEVIVWDRGTWTPDGDPRKDLARGRLEFHLDGEKLSGGWRLLRMNGRASGDHDQWLLIKRSDEAARPHSELDVAAEQPESVKSGRLISEIANGRPRARAKGKRKAARSKAGQLKPSDFPLALATLVREPPSGKDWLHEIKFDGYRILMFVERDASGRTTSRLYTRNQLDWTDHYPAVAQAATELPVESAVLDGELVALDDNGVSRFQLLQNAASNRSSPLVYFAFDLFHLDGDDLRAKPLAERKEALSELIGASGTGPIRYSDHIAGRGGDFLGECCRRGLEGIVSKRADRPHQPGRTHDWLKIKCVGREELVIGGFTDSTAAGRALGALLVGYFEDGRLAYAGRVGTGFNTQTLRTLRSRLDKLREADSPFIRIAARERGPGVHWVRPELVAQIEFGSWTDDGILRHASFQGLREDKPAGSVGRPESLGGPRQENSMPTPKKRPISKKRAKSRSISRSAAARRSAKSASVTLTHPERVLYRDGSVTKQDLADYYAAVAKVLLPHVVDRPLSMLRCPEGVGKPCFFQKHAAAGTPAALRRVPIAEKDGTEEYLVVDDAAGLTALAQMSVLEIHPWGSRADKVEQPDRLIFDLDPGPDVAWQAVIDGALALRDVLGHLELESFLKTSGGKGLHVVVPLTGPCTWPVLKQFARAVAEHLAGEEPDRYTAKMAKSARPGRVFIDYLRNDRGATAVAPYSPRARAGAPVAMPIAWDDLSSLKSANQFTIESARERLNVSSGDPWRGFFKVKQKLPKFATKATKASKEE